MSQRSPGLQEALRASFDYLTADMYTTIPGIVVSVTNQDENRVVVQPAINLVSHDMFEVSERPPVMDVPYITPQSIQGGLSFPVQAGDPVTLVFSMRGLDTWKAGNGYPTTPSDRRKFDIRDCVAVPGLFPFSENPNNPGKHVLAHDSRDVVLVHNLGSGQEAEVRIKFGSGDIEINAPQSNVKVVCQNASVDAEKKISYNATDYEITCVNYKLTAGNYAIDVDSDGTNVSTGVFRMNGQFILNNIAMQSHRHVETGSITNGPIN